MNLKVVIAGSRKITENYYKDLLRAIKNSQFEITEVVSGCAIGVDRMGERYATSKNIPIKRFPADWTYHGKAAGPIRNSAMAAYCDAAIILYDGSSPGTKNMIECMRKQEKPYYVDFVDVRAEDTPPLYKGL